MEFRLYQPAKRFLVKKVLPIFLLFSLMYPLGMVSAQGLNLDKLTSIFGSESSIGFKTMYIGTFDDVQVVYSGEKENVAGDVIGIDGKPVNSAYFEIVGSKGGGGIQRFRYEWNSNPLSNVNNYKRVNPFDDRGDSSAQSKLESNKAMIQRLSSDIAPFAKLPELVVSLREDYFHSVIFVKQNYGKSIRYIPYEKSDNTSVITSGENYWIDIKLEEITISWDFKLYHYPMRLSYFDIVFQKPVLLENTSSDKYDFDLYSPKFIAQGAQLNVSSIPLITDSIKINLAYGTSLSNSYMLLKNADESETLSEESKINLNRVNFGIDFQLSDTFYINYMGEFMWIKLDHESYNNQLISLDAINNLSLVYKF